METVVELAPNPIPRPRADRRNTLLCLILNMSRTQPNKRTEKLTGPKGGPQVGSRLNRDRG